MWRFVLIFGLLRVWSSEVHAAPSNLHTALSPFSVEYVKSPVKVETISIQPTVSRSVSSSASAVAIARTPSFTRTVPVVQQLQTFSSGENSNAELRDLLRSLLSELRGSNSQRSAQLSDSYSAPPRNTISDYSAPSYPDSDNGRRANGQDNKPEKIVLVQERQQPQQEYVRTVYQPVYLPVQYAQPEVLTVAQPIQQSLPVVSAVPTRVNTGASAVAYSSIHSSPALAIQQQQLSLPLTYASAGGTSAYVGYGKKK